MFILCYRVILMIMIIMLIPLMFSSKSLVGQHGSDNEVDGDEGYGQQRNNNLGCDHRHSDLLLTAKTVLHPASKILSYKYHNRRLQGIVNITLSPCCLR